MNLSNIKPIKQTEADNSKLRLETKAARILITGGIRLQVRQIILNKFAQHSPKSGAASPVSALI